MIQNLEEYRLLAKRTFKDLGSFEKNNLHMSCGMSLELHELLDPLKANLAYNRDIDIVNIGEEIADYSWFCVNQITHNQEHFGFSPEVDLKLFDKTYERACLLFENFISHNKDIKTNVATQIKYIYNTLYISKDQIRNCLTTYDCLLHLAQLKIVCSIFDLDYYKLLDSNINKLKVRYPDKYSDELANNRTLSKERTELEK